MTDLDSDSDSPSQSPVGQPAAGKKIKKKLLQPVGQNRILRIVNAIDNKQAERTQRFPPVKYYKSISFNCHNISDSLGSAANFYLSLYVISDFSMCLRRSTTHTKADSKNKL